MILTKRKFWKISFQGNVHSGKSPSWKIGFQGNVDSAKCKFWLMQFLASACSVKSISGKCTLREIYIQDNVLLASVFLGNVLSGRWFLGKYMGSRFSPGLTLALLIYEIRFKYIMITQSFIYKHKKELPVLENFKHA